MLGHYPCSSLAISISIAIMHWTNANTAHLSVHTARRKMQQSSASKERDITSLRWASGMQADGERMQSWCPGVCHCFQVSLWPSAPSHLFGLASKASVCSGGGQACNCRKRAAVHYSCLCRCALCACIYRLALFHPQDHRCQPPYVSAPQLTNTSDTIQIQTQLLGIYNPYFSIRNF